MNNVPTPGQAVKKVKKIVDSLPEPPTLRQLKEAEMERDSARASADRSVEKVKKLRAELKRVERKLQREKDKVAEKLGAEIDELRARAGGAEKDLADLKARIRKDAPFIDTVRKHADKEEATEGCACPACQVHRSYIPLREELASTRRKYRETREALKSFQGPSSKKKKGKRN